MFQTFISHDLHNDHLRWVLLSLFYRQGIQGLARLNSFLKFTKPKNLNHCPSDSRAYISPPVIAPSRTSSLFRSDSHRKTLLFATWFILCINIEKSHKCFCIRLAYVYLVPWVLLRNVSLPSKSHIRNKHIQLDNVVIEA